jgi:hypothetical protein
MPPDSGRCQTHTERACNILCPAFVSRVSAVSSQILLVPCDGLFYLTMCFDPVSCDPVSHQHENGLAVAHTPCDGSAPKPARSSGCAGGDSTAGCFCASHSHPGDQDPAMSTTHHGALGVPDEGVRR